MPNTREKLIELLFDCVSKFLTPTQTGSNRLTIEIHHGDIADYILASDFINELQNEAFDVGVASALHNKFGLSWDDAAGLHKEIKRLQDATKWISVKDRLPHKNMRVLACYTFDGYMQFVQVLDYYATDKKPHFQHEGDGMRVTHWMPLPEPPKE